MTKRIGLPLLVLTAVAVLATPAAGRIKLAALPVRQRVEIQLDNAGATLVEEERIVPLLKSTAERGNNRIDFSWSNTRVDKNSILFRPLAIRAGGEFRPIREEDGQKEVAVINTAYPPGENALVWEVYAAEACAVKVRVSYLIDNLTRLFSYRALANADETHLTLRKYIVLRNYSGETFGDAGVYAGFGPRFLKPVGQQERIRMLMHKFSDVPVTKTFTFNWYAHGALNDAKPLCSKVLMHYELTNDTEHKMGTFPLQPGKVRIFIDDGAGGEAFLGEDRASLTPIDDTMKLYLGEARDIVCKRIIETNERHHIRGNLHDQEIVIKYEIENFKDDPATLRIVEQLNNLGRQYFGKTHGDVEWIRGYEGRDKTSEEITFTYPEGGTNPVLHVDLPARPEDEDEKVEKVVVRFHVTLKNLWQ
ncbi:MAG: hypothetical protein KGY99_07110 [Phycisphaerae bacterium]|nr:hypothetical protein [Phycisphaerae bacterium]